MSGFCSGYVIGHISVSTLVQLISDISLVS